jgi:hypothetical protein
MPNTAVSDSVLVSASPVEVPRTGGDAGTFGGNWPGGLSPGSSVLLAESPEWRAVVTRLDCFALTTLDRVASNRTITPLLNAPLVMTGSVPSDDPRVTIPDLDGDPYLSEGNRLLFMYRRDYGTSGGTVPWTLRGAGIINQIEDAALSDDATTSYTAKDPWDYFTQAIPVLNSDGDLPRNGLTYTFTRGSNIVGGLLKNALDNLPNMFKGVDAGLTFGGTGFYAGTIEDTEHIDISFPWGTTLGQAWTQLTDTGTLDIVLTPIYDPINRPGYIAELNIYNLAGQNRPSMAFGWDRAPRSITDISRLIDGTTRANHVQYFLGVGGNPVTAYEDLTSIAKYKEYWTLQFWPGQQVLAAVEALAQAQLALRANGRVTHTLNPAPERSPSPWIQYNLGDRVPVYASGGEYGGFRQDLSGYQRVYGFPIQIADDQLEAVVGLLASPQGF